MWAKDCFIIENYQYRACPQPAREFNFAVSPHNHCAHSIENLASINEVVKLGFMRPFRQILQSAFGLAEIPNLNYADVFYRPPQTAEEVFLVESSNAASFGFNGMHVAITDHDEIAGSVELQCQRPLDAIRNPLGEELSFRFDDYLFHLGITALPESGIAATHASLQAAARANRLDDLFEMLRASGCLVVFNHPLVPWGKDRGRKIPAEEFLARYGWAVHALEYNGMRSQDENDRVLKLAEHVHKPVVGGGDSHLLLASSVLALSQAATFADFAAEVREGRAVSLVTPMYWAPLNWKIALRVFYFIAHYREIGHFRGQPVGEFLTERTVLLDPVGVAFRAFLGLTEALGLVR
jgi:predicted metal-dependent phosphoesterase TrpH